MMYTSMLATMNVTAEYVVICASLSSIPGLPLNVDDALPPIVPVNPSLLVVCDMTRNISTSALNICMMEKNIFSIGN